jgi:predicted metalloprotease with PDZ domain
MASRLWLPCVVLLALPAFEMSMITYRIELHDPKTHYFRVTLTVPKPAALQRLSLPVWIPGSYMVREFGRHLSQLQARQGERNIALAQLDKTTWQAQCKGSAALTVSYLVYAFDTSVRAAFLNTERGFFNGTSLCLRVEGKEAEPHAITLGGLPRGWQVATAMRQQGKSYLAADYHELVDHPFELGSFWKGSFKAHGVPHDFVVAGAWPTFDGERLLKDAQRICETQIEFWHGSKNPKAPMGRYVFLLNAVDEGYGGLEHRASTALIANRKDLPHQQVSGLTDGYVSLLGLISHEYFHTWNVKRLRPAELATVDYRAENYTQLLWFFEGFTSYYDDVLLLRSGLIDAPRYLQLLSKTISGVAATPGRKVQSVAESSFDAWVKYYRQDENTANATVSYYTKGSLVALALDASLRQEGRGCLDDVMRLLWRNSAGGPVSEAQIAQAFASVAGRSMASELQAWVHGTDDLPLPKLLGEMGVASHAAPTGFTAQLGLRLAEGASVQVKAVSAGSAAAQAGVCAGDELLAVNNWRIRRLDDAQQWLQPGVAFELLLARDQRLHRLRVQPVAQCLNSALALAPKPSVAMARRRRAWLGV